MAGEKNWIVVTKDGKWNAAVDNHRNTEKNLIAQGWEIIGTPLFKHKVDAIDYVKASYAQHPPGKRKRRR